ncbi:hypothetical protein LCGC14_2538840, partial [marine sediment metagenome]
KTRGFTAPSDDTDAEAAEVAEELAKKYKCEAVKNYYDMVGKVDGMIFAGFNEVKWWPQLTKPYLEAGIPCFINRPFAYSMKDANTIIKTAKKHTYFETINKFEAHLERYTQSLVEGKRELYRIQKELVDVNDDIHRSEEKKSRYERTLTEEQKSEDTFKKISKLHKDRDHFNKQLGQIEERIKQLENKIEDEEKHIIDLDIEYSKLETEKGKKKGEKDVFYYKNIYAKLNDVDDLRKKLAEIIGGRIREETRTETENILIQLVKDPDQWKNVTITDKTSGWEINAKFGDTIITNISTGMTNILGLSFIFALSNILEVDLPLIFDSPFGNLDAETRELITKRLPPIFKGRQIIFLEKKVNLTGPRNEDGSLRELYPELKKFIDYEYHLQNQTFINAQIIEGD